MKKISYSILPTEKPNRRSKHIDRLPIEKIVELINREDQKVPRAVSKVKKPIKIGVKMIVRTIKTGGKIYFAGAGTSGRLGVLEAAECPPTFNTSPSLIQAHIAGGKKAVFRSVEGAEDGQDDAYRFFKKKIKKQDLLVGIAASGVTPFVKGALEAARHTGAGTILIACNSSSPLKQTADCLISPKVGPEVITGSTRLKAGTATKMILNTLTVTSMIQLGKVYQNWMVDLQPKNKKLTARAVRMIELLGSVSSSEARSYLEKSKRNVKLAILMAKKGWDLKSASEKLKQKSGFLRDLLH